MNTILLQKGKHVHQYEDEKYDVLTFYSELVWEEICTGEKYVPIHRVWRYVPEMFACPSCERSIDVYFIIEQQGVFLKCMYCGVACPAPAFDLEENKNRADKLVDEPVEYVEALKICERIGQSMPEEIRGPTTRIRRVPRKR